MKSRITRHIEKLHADNPHCDLTSSKIRLVNAPIPTELFNELEIISSEYNRNFSYLAGDFLTLTLEEVVEHIPVNEKKHLDNVKHDHDVEFSELLREQNEFNVGGTWDRLSSITL